MGELALVPRAAAGDAARDDLAALGHEAAQTSDVLVVDEGEEARFLPLLAGLGRVVAVDRHPEIRDGGAAGRVAQLRGAGQVADEQYLVEARHQTTSSRTLVSPSGGSGAFLERAFLLR